MLWIGRIKGGFPGSSRRRFLQLSEAAALGGLLAAQGAGEEAAGDFILEPAKKVPVARRVDVVVAGAGIAGLFASLGAAKFGARTVLVDRFGEMGGNIGPGMIIGGSLYGEVAATHHGGVLCGIPKTFMERVMREQPRTYPEQSQAVSRTATEMMERAGVETILSVYAADPILNGNRVEGLFVETKSGRMAVRAKVVVDATGDADVARRAGAPVRYGCAPEECRSPNVLPQYDDPNFARWNETGLVWMVAGAEIAGYNAFIRQDYQLTAEDKRWLEEELNLDERANYKFGGWPARMVPLFRRAWQSGEFRVVKRVRQGFGVCFCNWFEAWGNSIVSGRTQARGEYDAANWEHISLLESAVRTMTYDGVRFLRRNVPGFESAHLIDIAPFLGGRGGPHIDAEHTLTPQESWAGARFPDVMYVNFGEVPRGAEKRGHDMPYAMTLPKKIEGLLVTARGAGYLRRGHDPGTRIRPNMMSLGQAAGMAAALAVRQGVTPRKVDVKQLQMALLEEGFYLGDEARLAELGLKR